MKMLQFRIRIERGLVAALLLLLTLQLTACRDDAKAEVCGQGEAYVIGGAELCMYEQAIVIETGFKCPKERPHRYDRENCTVCSDRELTESELSEADEAYRAEETACVSGQGRITSQESGPCPGTGSVTWTYDDVGNILTLTESHISSSSTCNSGSHTTSWTYDAAGNRISQTLNGKTTAWTYTYDADGNILTKTDERGLVTTFTYDADGNRLTTTGPYGDIWTYTYDADGNLLTEIDLDGNLTTYTYDADGNRLTEAHATWTITWTYDADGNMLTETQQTLADGEVVETYTYTYTYDADGNMLTATAPFASDSGVDPARWVTTTWTYDEAGNKLTQVDDYEGNTTTWTYECPAAGEGMSTPYKNLP